MVNIVTVTVSQQVAPTPSTLQQTGAFISWGGTNTAPGTISLLTAASSITPLLNTPKAITSITWTSSVATVTTTAPHNMTSGDTIPITIAGATPTAYNGNFTATVTGASTFTYPLVANPGSETTPGTWATQSIAELTAMNLSFWSQGSYRSVRILELGPLGPTKAVAALQAFITAAPNTFYSYLVPRCWDANAAYLAMLANYESTTAKTYFFTTTTLATYTNYTAAMKCVVPLIEAPAYGQWSANALTAITYTGGVVNATTTNAHGISVGQWFQISGCVPTGYNGYFQAQAGTTGSTIVYNSPVALGSETTLGTLVASYMASTGIPSTEFSLASGFWITLSYAPSATNRVTPLEYSFVYGVTPFPTFGNSALLQTLKSANCNVIGTGAEGGISNTIFTWGFTADGNKFNYWYTTDGMAINCDLALSNAIINGSNNPVNPLYYNQQGINVLSNVLCQVVNNFVTFGMVLFTAQEVSLDGPALNMNIDNGVYVGYSVVNAVPFITYANENPSDYAIGRYAGFSVLFTPQNGFDSVVINLVVSSFVSSF